MLNFVLCDDNLHIVSKMKDMLETLFTKHDIDAKVSFCTDDPNKILDYEKENVIDVLILDINLNSDISGIELAKIIRKNNKNVYIIFSTGHLEYSLLAYSVKTFDYLPKPITIERLDLTLARLMDDIQYSNNKFLYIDNKIILNQDDINIIKKDGMKLVFCTDTHNYETYSSFNKLKSILPDNFIRCHKSYIVNTNNIANINSNKNQIIFHNNITCGIGPKYKNNLTEVFNNANITNNLDSINDGESIIN